MRKTTAALILAVMAWGLAGTAYGQVRCLPGVACGNYDVILVAGQSNATSRGVFSGDAPLLDNDRIWQIGRRTSPGAIVPAFEPLENVTAASYGVSFAMAFARAYREQLLSPARSILIVPVAKGSTSVVGPNAYWRPDGPGVAEAKARLASVLGSYPNSRLVAVLWHQGEADRAQPADVVRPALLATLAALTPPGTPLVLGQLLPGLDGAGTINDIVIDTARELKAAVASSKGMTSLPRDDQHFDGPSQMSLGWRYFCGFLLVRPSSSMPAQDDSTCRDQAFAP